MAKSKNNHDKFQNIEYWKSCVSNKNDFPEVFFTLLGVMKTPQNCFGSSGTRVDLVNVFIFDFAHLKKQV